ncbi:class I adenylate-forming enzyme family protein [[Mycobacterium] fortunisiensis]|uniref:class I adenylate-forming enzyme family protein n=1 Tax=[Mycobacterium] fortunisiensis TaxID=2600579 RepID=UPI001C2695DA|nr:class I adenylate-forming enzyme family protein [[Mycobacterium] fortunisiensis]
MDLSGAQPIPADLRKGYVEHQWWNGELLRDGVESHALRDPTRRALSDQASSWTYQQTAQAISRVIAVLRRRGVGHGSAALVVAPLSAAAVIAYHAIIRSGGVAVMLDRRAGRSEVAHAIATAGVGLIVSTGELLTQLESELGDVPRASFDELLAGDRSCTDWVEPDPDRPSVVLFTSGTTSRPKAVVHSLNTVRAAARNLAEAVAVTDRDVAFLSSPLASVTGIVQIHLTLDRGATLLLEERFDRAGSLRRICDESATLIGGAPVILEELLSEADAQGISELPLRSVLVGGSVIPRALLDVAAERYGITPVRIYGSSEAPCAVLTLPSDTGPDRVRDDGACAPGTELRVDGPGELLVRGPVRFLGYLDEQHNEGAFAGDGWFRTGDLGRVEHGRLTVAGRLTETASRKGLKVSLAEIDERVAALPGIREAAAFALPDTETGERVAVAVIADVPDAMSLELITTPLVDAGLAKWKLPEQIVLWEGPLPRTESGKVQRRVIAERHARCANLYADRVRWQ